MIGIKMAFIEVKTENGIFLLNLDSVQYIRKCDPPEEV
jgi:hypothetical protein